MTKISFVPSFVRMEILQSTAPRIERGEALELLEHGTIFDMGKRADSARRNLHGNIAYYSVNAAVTYSNICQTLCPICSFARREGSEGAYLLTPAQAHERAVKFAEKGAREIHIIGGMNPKLPLDYYLDFVRSVKSAGYGINIVAFTVSECVLMSRVSGKPLDEVLKMLMEAGVDALPGGGAEIFDDSIRSKISPNKLRAEEWLDAMRTAHLCGLKTNATMLYGHIETPESVVDHLLRLRGLQDETGGFKAFVPLPYRRGKSDISSKSSGIYDIKITVLARIVLDNFPHIRVPITHFGDRQAQVLLNFGADDIGGTHWMEEVAVSAGAKRMERSESFMRSIISAAGFDPLGGNSNYAH